MRTRIGSTRGKAALPLLLLAVVLTLPIGLRPLRARAADSLTEYGRARGGPASLAEIEEEHRQSMAFVTPHTEWARPYARGAVRMLFFCQVGRWDTLSREAVELMQRFDITADAVYFGGSQDPGDLWIGGKAGEERMLRLLQQPYDVYLFMHISPGKLPGAAREKVVAAVVNGAGLALVGTDDGSRMKSAPEMPTEPAQQVLGAGDVALLKPEDQLREPPAFLARGPVGDAYNVGRGRAIRLPARPDIGYRLGWEVEYDYWQERLGRAILWAAKREPRASLTVAVSPAEIAWSALPAPAISIAWDGAPAREASLEVWARLAHGDRVTLGRMRLRGVSGTGVLQLPKLPSGTHHIEAFMRGPEGTEAWDAAAFRVTSARTVQVVLDRGWGEIGKHIIGVAEPSGPAVPRERLNVRLVDRRGRVLVSYDIPPGDKTGAFVFPVETWMPMLLRVEAAVISGDHEVASDYAYFRVTKRRQDRFNFVMWNCPTGTGAAYAQEALARHGVTAVLGGGDPGLEQAAYDVPWVPYTTYISNKLASNGVTEGGCWNDMTVTQKRVDELAARYLPSRQHGVFVYSLGDEGDVAGSCLHPACLDAYRRFLEKSYGAIAALNSSWGSNYMSFAEITLAAPGAEEAGAELPTQPEERLKAENDQLSALRAKNYPRWYDRLAFQRYNLVEYCRRYAEAYRRMDPLARTGFEGSAGRAFGLGADVEAIVKELDFWGPYPSSADELIRAIAPRKTVRSNWMGYAKNAEGLLYPYWRTVTRGADSVWFWMCAGLGTYHGFLAPDLSPFAATTEMLADTQVLRDGLGDLLIRATRLDDGIALFYSMPSECASGLEDGASFGLDTRAGAFVNYERDQAAWHQALWDLGLQFTYVTDRMLKAAPLDPKRCKVLILPRADALGAPEERAIRAFVEAGGTVIADARPGLYDDHCKPLGARRLDDLFGIRRQESRPAAAADLRFESAWAGGPLSVTWTAAEARALGGAGFGPRVDPAVSLAGGTALGEADGVPVGVVRTVGKGRAVLLNFSLWPCFPVRRLRWDGSSAATLTPEPILRLLEALLGGAGVEPAVRLTDLAGKPVRGVEVIRWQQGGITLLALLRQSGPKEQAVLELPPAGRLYDLKRRQALGKTARATVEIAPARPALLAILPTPAPAPRLVLSRTRAACGQVLRASVSVPGAAGLHALRLRLTAPDGAEADWLDPVLLAGRQPVEVPIPIAYNDQAGEWTLEVTDLFGGRASVKFRVGR